MATGNVKWFDSEKGYGFIQQHDGGPDLFVHFSSVEGDGFKSLTEGQQVQFNVTNGPKGQMASNVAVL